MFYVYKPLLTLSLNFITSKYVHKLFASHVDVLLARHANFPRSQILGRKMAIVVGC